MEAEGDAVPAILKVVQVFLWDDARPGDSRQRGLHDGAVAKLVDPGFGDQDTSKFSPEREVIEDLDLAQEMGALGLPISFSTNKERRKSSSGLKKKVKPSHKEPEYELFDFCSTGASVSSSDPQSSCDNEATSLDYVVEHELSTGSCDILQVDGNHGADHKVVADSVCEEELSDCANDALFIADISSIYEKQGTVSLDDISNMASNNDMPSVDDVSTTCCLELNITSADLGCNVDHFKGTENEHNELETESCHIDSVESVQLSLLVGHSTKCDDCKCPSDLRNWFVAWDTYYTRNYYYNVLTEESTWNNPLCPGCLSLLLYSDGTKVSAAEDNRVSDTTCNYFERTCAGTVQRINSLAADDDDSLTFQLKNETTSILNYGIGNSISSNKLLCVSDCLHNIEESNLPNNEQLTVAQQASSCEDNTKRIAAISPSKDYVRTMTLAIIDQLCLEGVLTIENNRPQADYVQNDHPDYIFSPVSAKKKKVKGTKSRQRMKCGDRNDLMLPEEMEGFSSDIMKYWCQRYLLFSKFDSGIKMDEEGWFSVTPECIARHHAERCCGGTVIDCFAGVGGNAIQFAMKSYHVIAIDIDPYKIDCARQNAIIYGVQDSIDFIQGDFFQLTSKLKGDAVFLSPPWGGPDYLKADVYDIRTMLKPHDGFFLFEAASHLAPKIIMFLPRNVNLNQLVELSQSFDPPWELEVEENYLNGKLKAITAYLTHHN